MAASTSLPQNIQIRSFSLPSKRTCILVAFTGASLPLILGALFPALHIDFLTGLMDLHEILLFSGVLMGLCAFWYYFDYVVARPHLILYLFAIIWPCIDFMARTVDTDAHTHTLMMLAGLVPVISISLRHWKQLWQFNFSIRFFAFFMVVLTWFYLFNNINMPDTKVIDGGSIASDQYWGYIFGITTLIASCMVFNPQQSTRQIVTLVDRLNIALMIFFSTACLLSLVGYPVNWLMIEVDGFNRSTSIFAHPNEFAHELGMFYIYMMGLWGYYQKENSHRVPRWLLMATLILGVGGLATALSKTAVFGVGVSALVFGLVTLRDNFTPKKLLIGAVSVAVLLPAGLFALNAATGHNIIELLSSRMEQTGSFDWRMQIWQNIEANLNGVELFTGHGFTAANALAYQLMFHDALEPHPLIHIHNNYLQSVYDFGVLGLSLFIGIVIWMITGIRDCMTKLNQPAYRGAQSLTLAFVMLCFYYLLVCGVEEFSYSARAFWMYTTLSLGCSALVIRQLTGKQAT